VLSSLVVAKLVSGGHLDYSSRVCDYWPEFASNGKHNILLKDLMRHEAGMTSFDGGQLEWKDMSVMTS